MAKKKPVLAAPDMHEWPDVYHSPKASGRPSYNWNAYERYCAGEVDAYGREKCGN
jgi:hypothetical protein